MLQTQKTRCSLQWDLTFFKQKLALLTAHHDPYHCSMCGISAPDKMKFCSKCDLARYCSRKCQTEDWKKSHKVSCHKIVSLRHSIFRLSERYDEVQRKLGMDPVTTEDWLVSIKSPLVLLNSDSADIHVSSIVLSDSDSADIQVSKESSPLLIPASRCSGTVDSIEESQDSWIELDPRTSIFLDVILILM